MAGTGDGSDDSDKKEDTVFIVKSLFANSTGDMLIRFPDAKTAKAWKERLQAASFFHNMPREKQLAGLAAGKSKPRGAPAERKVDDYGNRLSVAAPKGIPIHDLPPTHVDRERGRPGMVGDAGAGAGTGAKGGAAGGGKAASHFRGPVKSFTIIGMEVRNASTTFDDPFLAVGVFGTGGTPPPACLALPRVRAFGACAVVQGGWNMAEWQGSARHFEALPPGYSSQRRRQQSADALRHRRQGVGARRARLGALLRAAPQDQGQGAGKC